MYFKCDEGYYSVANLEFSYNKDVSVGYAKYGPSKETNEQPGNDVQGVWVDLSGEQINKDEWTVEWLKEWSIEDFNVLEEIKSSFPCYQDL